MYRIKLLRVGKILRDASLWTNDSGGNKKCNNELQKYKKFSLCSLYRERESRSSSERRSFMWKFIFGRKCNYCTTLIVENLARQKISRDIMLAVLNSSRNNSSGKSLCSFRMPNKSGQNQQKIHQELRHSKMMIQLCDRKRNRLIQIVCVFCATSFRKPKQKCGNLKKKSNEFFQSIILHLLRNFFYSEQ